MDKDDFGWPLGETSGVPMPGSAEARLQHEGADWGPAARALLTPQLRYVEPAPAPSDRQWRQFMGEWKG